MALSTDLRTGHTGDVTLTLRGEIDQATIGQFREGLDRAFAAGSPNICVDLGLVTYADSVAFGALVAARRRAAESGAQLSLANLSPFVDRAIRLMGLAQYFGLSEPTPG